jgi:hypothetical protein
VVKEINATKEINVTRVIDGNNVNHVGQRGNRVLTRTQHLLQDSTSLDRESKDHTQHKALIVEVRQSETQLNLIQVNQVCIKVIAFLTKVQVQITLAETPNDPSSNVTSMVKAEATMTALKVKITMPAALLATTPVSLK